MSGLELEAYIINATVIGCLLAKATKWVLEELQPMVVEYAKLRDNIRKVRQDRKIRAVIENPAGPSKSTPSVSSANEPRSKDKSNLAA